MAKLILIRHGETVCNIKKIANGRMDCELTERGNNQGVATANYLESMNLFPVEIWTSPLKRAIKTAEYIKQILKSNLLIKEELIERDFGQYEGALLSTIEWESASKEMESNSEIFERINPLVEDLKENQDKTVVVVTHASIIKHFIYLTLGFDKKIAPQNCSITMINVNDFESEADEKYYNYTEHLIGMT